jgi:hypothetical protein
VREYDLVKLLRVGPAGSERPALLAGDGTLHDLCGVTRDIDGYFLAGGGIVIEVQVDGLGSQRQIVGQA